MADGAATSPVKVRQRAQPEPLELRVSELEDGDDEPSADPIFDAPKNTTNELAQLVAKVSKSHGPHVLRRARDTARFMHIPTGIFTLDMGLLGGIPRSLISMIYGWESSGKSTTAWRLIANTQRLFPDEEVCLVEPEGTFDPIWAARQGVDIDRLIISQPDHGEQAIDIARALIETRNVSLVVLDSLPALQPIEDMEKSAEDNEKMAMQARLIGTMLRRSTSSLINERKRGHLPGVFLINQFREKPVPGGKGDPRTLPGGNPLKFFVSVRWQVMNKEVLGKDARDTEVVDYNEHSFKITKNKVGNSLRNGTYEMWRNPDGEHDVGFIDDAKHVLTFARKFELLTGGGSSWRFGDVNHRFTKLQECLDYLYENPAYYEAMRHQLICLQRKACGLEPEGWL